MRLPFLLLCSLFAFTLAGVATVDFAATVPECYNHQTGGGSFNDASNRYVIESLEGGDFACGDVVSYLWYVVVEDDSSIKDNSYMEFLLQFTGTTTGQEGVGFTQVRGNKIYINQPGQGYVHGDGCTYSDRIAGTCTQTTTNCNQQTATSYDSGAFSAGTAETAVLIRQWFSGAPPFVAGSTLNVALRIGGVTRKDRIVIRIDVEIACDPYRTRTPSGNIQGSFYDGWLGTSLTTTKPAYLTDRATADISNVWAREGTQHEADVVPSKSITGGTQTVPLKNVENVRPCTAADNMKCIDFVSYMRVTSEGGEGYSYGKFNYCWTNGKMSWIYGTAPSYSATSAIRTFDVACTSNHLSLYDTAVGPCGTCELVQQFPTSLQPQLCYNDTANFWQPNPASETITVIPEVGDSFEVLTWHYTANASAVQGTGVTDLWLRQSDSMPIRIRFNDGKVFTFFNQTVDTATACASSLYTPATCTSFLCGRPLDLAIVQELSKNTDTLDQAGVRAFINLLIAKFVFGPTNVQVGYITFNSTATTRLSLAAGTSRLNVGAAVNATGCTSNNGACTGSSFPSVGIIAGANMLAGSTRSTATASRVVLMIVNEIEEPSSAIDAAIAYAATKGVYVICVAYNSGTPTDLFYALTSDPGTYGSRTQNLFYIPFQDDLANPLAVTSVATRLCGLVSYSAACTTCCESLLCNTAGTLCGGTPCSNQAVTCPPYYADDGVTLHCELEYVKDETTGCCKVAFRSTSPCSSVNNASCYSQTCNSDTGLCDPTGGCPDTTPFDCKDRQCSATAPYTCIEVTRATPTHPGGCVESRCNPDTGNIEWFDTGCTGVVDACQSRSCQLDANGVGTCVITADLDDNPPTDKCITRVCDPVQGWIDASVKTCDSPAPCVNARCDPETGQCVNTNVLCGDPLNLCSTVTCIGSPPNSYTCTGAPSVDVVCEPDPCYETSQCLPGTGQCVNSDPIVCPFDDNTGCTMKCNPTNNLCINNTCPPPPPPGCTAVCISTVCETSVCEILGAESFCSVSTRDCSKEVLNTCQSNEGCSTTAAVPGCQIKTRDCQQEVTDGDIVLGKCEYIEQDPTHPDCCIIKQKTCSNADPCSAVACNETTGACDITSLCITSNPCFPVVCTATGCQETVLCTAGIDTTTCATRNCIPDPDDNTKATCGTEVTVGCATTDKCKVGVCNAVTKACEFSALCSNGTNKCVNTFCDAEGGFCYDVPVATESSFNCKKAYCDPAVGPVVELDNDKCQDGNPCFISTCQADGNCSRVAYDCNGKLANQSYCKPVICQDFIGCTLVDLDCFANSSVRPENGTCQTVQCVDCTQTDSNQACLPHTKLYTGYCKTNGGACFPLFALIGGLAGGIIAAIVVCGLIALALVGGGVGAVAHSSATPDEHAIFNNPLFKEKGMAGQSPL